jgi:hypothetical protein
MRSVGDHWAQRYGLYGSHPTDEKGKGHHNDSIDDIPSWIYEILHPGLYTQTMPDENVLRE